MIRLGSLAGYSFEGPRVLAGWTPPATAGVYAVLYPVEPDKAGSERLAVCYVGHAADLDSSGKPVPPDLARRIADMRKQVEDQRDVIARKQTERDQAIAKFDDDLAHYRTLVTKTKAQ